MGDSSDNIPGVPGIGEKTASKLIAQYGSIENLLAHSSELKGKMKETLEKNRDQALLSKRLATIDCNAPCELDLEKLYLDKPNEEALRSLCIEFEFNSMGRRLFGEDFKAGRGFPAGSKSKTASARKAEDEELLPGLAAEELMEEQPMVRANLKTVADVPHDYPIVSTPEQRKELIKTLLNLKSFCFDTETTELDFKAAQLVGLSFSFAKRAGFYVPIPTNEVEGRVVLGEFRPAFENEKIEKVGHNLKFDLSVLKRFDIDVRGTLFDTMIAHCLVEPDMRHTMDYLSEAYLGYTPIPITKLIGDAKGRQLSMAEVPLDQIAEYAAEDADVTWQLRSALEAPLKRKRQERVFHEVEAPLGIRVDAEVLGEIGAQMAKDIASHQATVWKLAGQEFNLNSTRQLGSVLFEGLKVSENPKKTKTGLYATDEQTLLALASEHEIVQRLLEYRELTKLKSTYVDALPTAISPQTGRVHTTYQQAVTATGRLNSHNPNLQNIPIRTEQGKEIRKAFVPRDDDYLLLSADYSQIELRIIAALSREAGLLEAFNSDLDVHTATAARVFSVSLEEVTSEMRRKAKMVNYGIAYGISSFGLAQRLNIPRKEGATIIEHYFAQFPGIRKYMDDTIAFARQHGFVETVTGRRRYLRDIRSANATIRSAAERNAINAPIQGTAADMIKLAMIHIHQELTHHNLKTKMLLQVHDELVFDLYKPEKDEVLPLVQEKMKNALVLDVPIVVELGTGKNWLEAH